MCPECGLAFDLGDPTTFASKPPRLWWRYWLPALVLASVVGLASMLVCVLGLNSWGYGAFVATPLCSGALLGYGLRVKVWIVPVIAIVLGLCLILGLVTFQLAGVFCSLVLAGIFAVPLTFGALAGWVLRSTMKSSRFSQRWHLPTLMVFAFPVLLAGIEGESRAGAVERVATTCSMRSCVGDAWASIMYYEEVTHEPPWILKVGLARPLSTSGRSDRVGEVKKCLYNKGWISKQIVRVETERELEFRVVEQNIGYETSIRLVGGSFRFEPSADGTLVTLTTEYRPLLDPRFAWRPAERLAIHILHNYVLEGMRRKAELSREVASVDGAAALPEGAR